MRTIRMDYETFSELDLTKVGAFRYACHPSTRILMCALAEGDEEPVIWIPPKYESDELFSTPAAIELMDSLADDDVVIYAFNSQFEWAITKFCFTKQTGFRCPRIEQFRCTAVMTRKAALPADLDGASRTLELRERKDTINARHMKTFSSLVTITEGRGKNKTETTRRVLPTERPQEFHEYALYCLQDVRSERELHKKLEKFEYTAFGLRTFLFDARMNDRGIPVNLPALHNALQIIQEEGAHITEEFSAFVGLRPTQNAKFKEWLRVRGYPKDNLQADTITEYLEDVYDGEVQAPPEVVRALELKQKIAFAAASKVAAMINCADSSNVTAAWFSRVCGVFYHYGARTGRWSAKYIQPQNFKRPTDLDGRDKYADEFAAANPHLSAKQVSSIVDRVFGEQTSFAAYRAICGGISRDALALLYGPPLEVISSCIRHFIHLPGTNMLDADYSSIEARIVAWLAGEEKIIKAFRDKADLYVMMASKIFGTPKERISKKGVERFVGKQTILGCGFGMGVPKFLKTCAKYGQKLSQDIGERAVYAFRDECSKIVDLWHETERAARNAIMSPNRMYHAGRIRFFSCFTAGRNYLIMKLPSDRFIAYPDPKIEDNNISFFGNIKGKHWGRVGTYGGKLVENATQAVAADIMSHGAAKAEAAGYEIFALIHDEALCLPKRGQTIEEFCRLLIDLPPWADGLPIEAEGDEIEFYTK